MITINTKTVACVLILSSILFGNSISAQVNSTNAGDEEVYNCWYIALNNAQLNNKIPRTEFETFERFSEKALDSLRADFLLKVVPMKIKTSSKENYIGNLGKVIFSLYGKYEIAAKTYPSSVDEYRKYKLPLSILCDSIGCDNIGFESGDLTGWNTYYALNSSGISSFAITKVTGGLAGAVTHAANDTLTSTPGYYNAVYGPNPRPDYQINITSGNRGDVLVPSVPVVSPYGGRYSVMLGDSTRVNYGVAMLSQTFKVTANNDNFTYQYAAFIENPAGHVYYQRPFFQVTFLDGNGDTIPGCGTYITLPAMSGFKSIFYASNFDSVYYNDWTSVLVSLNKYIGQCVTVIFETGDCSLGGHFAYAYIDASCAPLEITSSSPTICKQTCVTLSAPPGGLHYQWMGPINGITGSDTIQQICADSAGIYSVVITPVGGSFCNDTLFYTLGRSSGPIPQPSFYADTVCNGTAVQFYNTSHPDSTSSAKFYWDFYNTGSYEDSITNPKWTYSTPGTYIVKLDEVYNGCGQDTLVTIVVDSCHSTGIPKAIETEKLNIYPNPSNGSFTLEFGSTTGDTYSTYVYNALGEEVYSSITEIGTNGMLVNQIDLNSVAKGIYAVELYRNGILLVIKKVAIF